MYRKMNILFYPKKVETDTDGKVMIYTRVTISGRRSEFSLGHRIEEQRWDSHSGRLRGTSLEVSNLNRFLDNFKIDSSKFMIPFLRKEKMFLPLSSKTPIWVKREKGIWSLKSFSSIMMKWKA